MMNERPPPDPGPETAARIAMCRTIAEMRKALACCLGESFSPAPYLDMLLDLYVSQSEGQDTYVWSLCMATSAPLSTAHRKITDLEQRGLLALEPGLTDRRRVGVQLTQEGEAVVVSLVQCFETILGRVKRA